MLARRAIGRTAPRTNRILVGPNRRSYVLPTSAFLRLGAPVRRCPKRLSYPGERCQGSSRRNSRLDRGRRLWSSGPFSDFELLLADLRCQFDTADCDRGHVEALEAQHRPNLVVARTVILLNDVVPVLVGRYPTRYGMMRDDFISATARCDAA